MGRLPFNGKPSHLWEVVPYMVRAVVAHSQGMCQCGAGWGGVGWGGVGSSAPLQV
jgi:hypothetical protein